MKNESLVELGISNKPHGIKGATLFKLHNQNSSVLVKGAKLTLAPILSSSTLNEDGEVFTISSISFGNKVICTLEEVTDRNHLERILPFKIMYPRELFPPAPKGEIYLQDLIGCTVFDTDGDEIGEIIGEYDNGAQSVISMLIKGDEVELPFVDNFFLDIDINEKRVVVQIPEFI